MLHHWLWPARTASPITQRRLQLAPPITNPRRHQPSTAKNRPLHADQPSTVHYLNLERWIQAKRERAPERSWVPRDARAAWEDLRVRHNPKHASDDPEVVRRLIRENPWGILVSSPQGRPVASHYPVLLDEDSEDLAVFTHVGRPDEEIHGFGDLEMLLIIQGNHGYISPSWYSAGASRAPTWNFSSAHCYGRAADPR